jgi:hypothetical protein
MTGQVQRRPTLELRQALREPATGRLPAPERPSSVRLVPASGAIPTSALGQARLQPARGPRRARPRSAREPRAAPRARPTYPGPASPARPPVGPSLARASAVRRRSALSGSGREPPWREEPRSKPLQPSGSPALPGEPGAPPSCACGVAAPSCKGCRRPAPPPPGLCMRIQPTFGGEPPLRRFRPEISHVKQQSRSAEVWHPSQSLEIRNRPNPRSPGARTRSPAR